MRESLRYRRRYFDNDGAIAVFLVFEDFETRELPGGRLPLKKSNERRKACILPVCDPILGHVSTKEMRKGGLRNVSSKV